ncbi:MAG: radical SAM protein [Proteobacteria bacterium]|nr:radical SAM protein [Desulfobulbaceae bacterium]MBU4153578.1 radical SAM protein [Pseudomonadota bacterium]
MTRQLQQRTLAFQDNERNVFFHILTACNLSCRHCYINPSQHGSATLPETTINAWLKLFASPEKKTNLILLGGEPTLHPALPSVIKTARALGYHSVTVDTNGFLHHDLLNHITPDEAVLSFSLDGPTPEINDPLRGHGVFATCTQNLAKAVAMGFEVSVIYTVSAMNIAHLADMPRLLAELGVHHFFIQIIGLRGNSAQASDQPLQISHKQWLTTVPKVAMAAAQLGLHVIYPKVFLGPGEAFACAGNVAENFFIFPNGRVYCCPLCEDFPIHSYQIEDNALHLRSGLIEKNFFSLQIPEGCVMNKLLQPGSIAYHADGQPHHRISCCLLKQEIVDPDTSKSDIA